MVKRWRIPVIYSVAVPLALILGYLVSSPDEITFTVLAMVMFFLALPLILKWHHALLIIFWNAAFNAYFLPGQPDAWLLFGALSFGISFMNHIIFQKAFLRVPEMSRPVLVSGGGRDGNGLLSRWHRHSLLWVERSMEGDIMFTS